jgi:hypothetical protein
MALTKRIIRIQIVHLAISTQSSIYYGGWDRAVDPVHRLPAGYPMGAGIEQLAQFISYPLDTLWGLG